MTPYERAVEEYETEQAALREIGREAARREATRRRRGIAPLIVILIVGGILIFGGGVTLIATGNSKQALTCLQQATNSNPSAVGNLVNGLSTNNDAVVEGALGSFEPKLGECILLSLWNDIEVEKAQKTAAKVANKGRIKSTIGTVTQIKAAAQAASVQRGLYPTGTVLDGG